MYRRDFEQERKGVSIGKEENEFRKCWWGMIVGINIAPPLEKTDPAFNPTSAQIQQLECWLLHLYPIYYMYISMHISNFLSSNFMKDTVQIFRDLRKCNWLTLSCHWALVSLIGKKKDINSWPVSKQHRIIMMHLMYLCIVWHLKFS